MNFVLKSFDELANRELFEIYRLRAAVFVVEQNCPYQDIDDYDLKACHLLMRSANGSLIGYCRILPPGLAYPMPAIGRVVVDKDHRGKKFGEQLMKHSINKTLELFEEQEIIISAQYYLLKFYSGLGFQPEGEIYPEDGIPHIKMRFNRSKIG